MKLAGSDPSAPNGPAHPATVTVGFATFNPGAVGPAERVLAQEVPLALTYNGATYAVMMATPADLADFALGFSLGEGIVDSIDDISDLDLVPFPEGIEARMWVSERCAGRLAERRRRLTGPVGCGLCGLESLDEAVRAGSFVPSGSMRLRPDDIPAAVAAFEAEQSLNQVTRAVHGAGLWLPDKGLALLREDVGRHNALDKLAGAAARARLDATSAVVVLSSRVSVDLVQKASRLGAPILVAISAPTELAVREAERCNLTLVALARGDDFAVFTHAIRIAQGTAALQRRSPGKLDDADAAP